MTRGRSLSPRQQLRYPEPRASSEDSAVKRQIEELVASMAMMKEVFDAETAAKEEKRKKTMEKLERRKEEEEAQAAEEACVASQRRAERKEAKLRKEEEDRRLLRKELLMELSLRMGKLDESLQHRYEREVMERAKGKHKAIVSSSDDDDADSYESEVELLSRKTEKLVISEKRKRGAEKQVGDSAPMVTPAKRTAKQRLQLDCRHQLMKKTPPRKIPGTGQRKIPVAPGTIGKLKFVTDNVRELGDMTVEELKKICQTEDVEYEGTKMQAILAIAEKRTHIAFGEEEVKVQDEETGENQVDHSGRTKVREGVGRRRKGRRERGKKSSPEYASSKLEVVIPIRVRLSDTDDWSANCFQVLLAREEAGCSRFTLRFSGGNCWGGSWKSIRSSFRNSEVKIDGRRCKLCTCKHEMEKGVELEILHLRRWKPKISKDKNFLISILRCKNRVGALRNCNLDVLIRLTGAA
ncbi:hypothetical protein CBR_g19318 [Chara braunii]|uniref:Uncharacterized protein n=1 Tax=Chara braunii TaxID=69332 RepID=A0A388KXM9_CHABU|nr:hypothetical protein CBR_g19318 [Chara braunii]|eukprot:GBG74807.1 hypothetical protein CBR_g19318 [Chara braunii]